MLASGCSNSAWRISLFRRLFLRLLYSTSTSMPKKKKTTASGKLVLVKSVRRTRSHRMKFCVQRGLGALPSTSKQRGKSQMDFLPCGPVCINTGIACLFSPKMKRTSERIVKFHSLAQFVSNFSDNSVSSFTVSWV